MIEVSSLLPTIRPVVMSTNARTTKEESMMDRRQFLRASGGVMAAVGATGVTSRPALAQSAPLDDWFDGVENYEGVIDQTGQSEVRVQVGTEANGGPFGFDPAAIRVDPGTTVVWEWTGEGGVHNVAEVDGDFESELIDEEGATFEHTFETDGVSRYVCAPHEAMGMKGAVVVGEAGAGSESGGESVGTPEILTGGLAGAILVALFVLPLSEMRKRRRQSST